MKCGDSIGGIQGGPRRPGESNLHLMQASVEYHQKADMRAPSELRCYSSSAA